MHICLCSYEFGMESGPEGICTYRLVKALIDQGHKITIITASKPFLLNDTNIIQLSTKPFKPKALVLFVEKIVNRLLWSKHNISWIVRVILQKNSGYELIYGRSMPMMSNISAYLLSIKIGKPLMLHYSDPPLSPWVRFPTATFLLSKMISKILYKKAVATTFTTRQAIDYTEKRMNWPHQNKAHVLLHVAPPVKNLGYTAVQQKLFVYAGGIYGKRDPKPLLNAFKALVKESPDAALYFYGTKSQLLEDAIRDLALSSRVKIFPFTDDLEAVFSKANVLIALDAFDDDAIFLSTKIIDYYLVNRPVLLLSPDNSPASQLTKNFLDTVEISENSENYILSSMKNLLERDIASLNFNHRILEMHAFSSQSVVKKFSEILSVSQ